MAQELAIAIGDAVQISRDQQDEYCRIVVDGIGYLQRTFSWERNAQE
jgi:hypothetical protein